ncbi:MAG: prolipoprotein diacylglyceryl transferase [Myxococcales bacterium]
MIPWFELPTLHLGPLSIHSFGVLAAAGILVASSLISAQAKKRGLDPSPLPDFAAWAVGFGLLGGHLLHVLFYHPEELESGGVLQLFKFWDGLSSTGGVIGGLVGALVFFRRRRLSFRTYSDSIALGLAPGWAVARLGCFSVHDHPGRLSNFFLAVRFPEGARHDLGLDDALLLTALTGLLYALAGNARLRGHLLGVLALLYGVGRFLLDFLRATDIAYADARYLGLTPAQYVCVLFVAYGIFELRQAVVEARASRSATASHAGSRGTS